MRHCPYVHHNSFSKQSALSKQLAEMESETWSPTHVLICLTTGLYIQRTIGRWWDKQSIAFITHASSQLTDGSVCGSP